jgi:hypothetical protein
MATQLHACLRKGVSRFGGSPSGCALAGQAEAAEHDVDVAAVQLAVAGGSAAL